MSADALALAVAAINTHLINMGRGQPVNIEFRIFERLVSEEATKPELLALTKIDEPSKNGTQQ